MPCTHDTLDTKHNWILQKPRFSSPSLLAHKQQKDHNSNTDGVKAVTVLFLGAADSGKSTIVRHIRILHSDGLSESELTAFRHIVRTSNLEYLVKLVEDSDLFLADRATCSWLKAREEFLLQFKKVKDKEAISSNCALSELALTVWRDPIVQEVLAEQQTSPLDDPAAYFLPAMERIMMPGYIPVTQDILSVRVPTTGIVTTTFRVRDLKFNLIDVGGQRSERKKWLHCFESVNAVLFVASLSEYDQVLDEVYSINRMEESLKLFASVCNVKWFSHASMLLFLNKKDIFAEKIKTSPLSKYFPEFKGQDGCILEASDFVSKQFAIQNHKDREIYRHFTCAKDGANIGVVFSAVSDILQRSIMKSVGLF